MKCVITKPHPKYFSKDMLRVLTNWHVNNVSTNRHPKHVSKDMLRVLTNFHVINVNTNLHPNHFSRHVESAHEFACEHISPSKTLIKRHIETAHQINIFSCDQCD